MIPHNKPTFGKQEQAAAMRVLDSGWVAQGAEVAAFENELCRFFGVPEGHALAVSSGSAALYLALWALKGKGARIGVPVYSCSALPNAVALIGGKSIFLDCATSSPNLDISHAAKARINILIAPSMFGIPIDLPENKNYRVIEDLAQAFGAHVNGKRIGLRGDVGICSFYATKMITSGGQGGAVISHNKLLIDLIRDYREFDCREDFKKRFNFQMTDLQAAIGRVQLERLSSFNAKRERLFTIYSDEGLDIMDTKHGAVRYRAVLRTRKPQRIIDALAAQGVRCIVPIKKTELLADPNKFPIAQKLTETTVSLPLFPDLRENDVISIARVVRNVI